MWFYRRLLRVKWTDKRTNQSVLSVLQGKTQSARKRGRPPISYIENIKNSLGLNLQNITYESQDRNRWRHIVDRASCGATTIATDDAD